MISKDEIEKKAEELDIHVANVERDYVFGWLLKAFFLNEYLSQRLVFKGGNCMRKAYYPNTRFSGDLDFSVPDAIEIERFKLEINRACELAQAVCGVQFVTERNSFDADEMIDNRRQAYKGRVYFKDFHGNEDKVTISVRLDMTEFDRILLPTVTRCLIHPYSDADSCTATIPCMALEELMANKLKCLLQRRHSFDLYDLVYATFFEKSISLDRGLVLRTFLRKTIFEPSPGAAKEILLGLPIVLLRGAWDKYIVCPLGGRFDFDRAIEAFNAVIESIFGSVAGRGWGATAFFPSEYRNLIFDAGTERKLLRMTYDGLEREIEAYSLAYKRRRDGHAEEYFYAYDRTGGRSSGPGIKSFVRSGIQSLAISEATYEPRYPIELAKAGEASARGYFTHPTFGGDARSRAVSRRQVSGFTQTHKIECPYCNKRFTRRKLSMALKPHKDPNGYPCAGRVGYQVW
jgi:predicted nucleotidyltransferase component of viral defense system